MQSHVELVIRLETMGKKYQSVNAARARHAQWKNHAPTVTTTNSALVLSDPNGNSVLADTPNPITFDFSVSDSKCEYTGGVNVSDNSDDEYYKGSGDEVNSESDSDYSLAELEGEELDKNLQALQDEAKAELAQLEVPTAFERILKSVPDAVWKKAE